jgi:hypothetical protein
MRKLIQSRLVKSTTSYLNKSRVDRIAEAEKSLISADVSTKNTAMASTKRLTEKRVAAEQQVAELENEAESLGLVSGKYFYE